MNLISTGLYVLAVALFGLALWYYFSKAPSADASEEEVQAILKKNKTVAIVSGVLAIGSGIGGYLMSKKSSSSDDDSDDSEEESGAGNDDLDNEIDSI